MLFSELFFEIPSFFLIIVQLSFIDPTECRNYPHKPPSKHTQHRHHPKDRAEGLPGKNIGESPNASEKPINNNQNEQSQSSGVVSRVATDINANEERYKGKSHGFSMVPNNLPPSFIVLFVQIGGVGKRSTRKLILLYFSTSLDGFTALDYDDYEVFDKHKEQNY